MILFLKFIIPSLSILSLSALVSCAAIRYPAAANPTVANPAVANPAVANLLAADVAAVHSTPGVIGEPQQAESDTIREISPATENTDRINLYNENQNSSTNELVNIRTTQLSEIIGVFPGFEKFEAISVDSKGIVSRWSKSSINLENSKIGNLNSLTPSTLTSLGFKANLVALHPGSNLLAVASGIKLNIYSLKHNRIYAMQPRLKSRLSELEFSADGKTILAAGVDGNVYRWKFAAEMQAGSSSEADKCFERYVGHSAVVSQVKFHPLGRIFFSADWEGVLYAWLPYDADDFSGQYDKNLFGSKGFADKAVRIRANATTTDPVVGLEVSDNGESIYLVLQSGVVEWWKVRGFARVVNQKLHQGTVIASSLSPKSQHLALLGRAGVVKVYRLSNSEISSAKKGDRNLQASFSPELASELVSELTVEQASVIKFVDEENLLVGTSSGTVRKIMLQKNL